MTTAPRRQPTATPAGCAFCAEAARQHEGNLLAAVLAVGGAGGGRVDDRYILEESATFVVMPSIGAIVPGYCLVVPRRHVRSFAQLDACAHAELQELLGSVRHKLCAAFSDRVVVYEHGPVSATGPAGSCADHAHLHVVPTPGGVDLATPFARDFPVRRIAGLRGLGDQARRGASYLMWSDLADTTLVVDAPLVRSQYFRRLLAAQLGCREEWDWLVFPQVPNLRTTIARYPTHAVLR